MAAFWSRRRLQGYTTLAVHSERLLWEHRTEVSCHSGSIARSRTLDALGLASPCSRWAINARHQTLRACMSVCTLMGNPEESTNQS